MKTLNFSYNWNGKLLNDAFTTIRLSDYYCIDDVVEIKLKNELLYIGKVIGKIETRIEKLTELVCRLDTGYDRNATIGIIKKMYPRIENWSEQKIFIYTIAQKYNEKLEQNAEAYAKARIERLKKCDLKDKEEHILMRELYNL